MGAETGNENRFTFGIDGMTCASCVRIVDRSLRKMPGVKFVSINLGTEKGYVITEPGVTIDDIIANINSTGYRGLAEAPGEEKIMKDFKRSRRMMIESLAVMIPLTVLMILHMTGM
ncbi:MAG TPA: heavy metal-associated domain-containing protein, partial [Spirochaetota bacterium]|nr:heavy metal-associated domain-containing protein [Spirochaetota bacterium]